MNRHLIFHGSLYLQLNQRSVGYVVAIRLNCSLFILRWLKEHRKLNIFVEPRVKAELLTESSYYNFVKTWKDGELQGLFTKTTN